MTSINTNLSSLIVQKNLTKSTSALNQAIERLTTGYKINHASDNAANYSISESMTSKLSSYMVAEENTSMGLDLIRTQSSTLDTIQNLTTRLRALAEQAHNGTYGAQSLSAINQEANAIISEIGRIGNNAEYNGIKLFDNAISQAGIPQLKSNGLMQEVERRDTSGMTKLADVDENSPLAAGTYSISTAEELAKLATMQNNGNITAGSEFVLAADIDLADYCAENEWVAIGSNSAGLLADFDGNGYTISNLKGQTGLFDTIHATVENLILKDVDITSSELYAGGLVKSAALARINNCSVSGSVKNVMGHAGLIIGDAADVTIRNCYTSGNVKSTANCAGGLAATGGDLRVENCYSDAEVYGKEVAGGLVGSVSTVLNMSNSAFSGNVMSYKIVGGIVGSTYGSFNIDSTSCTGNIELQKARQGVQQYSGIMLGNVYEGEEEDITRRINGFYDSTLTSIQNVAGNIPEGISVETNVTDMASQLQVGVDSTDSSIIKFTTNISLSSINSLRGGMESANSLESIDSFISKLSESQTRLGAIENRLTSTIESIGVNIENLTSSRSTLKDADVAKESSQLVKNQILQQAAATLLSTANQTPSLALRLLNGM